MSMGYHSFLLTIRKPSRTPVESMIYFHLRGSAQRPVGNSLEMGGADASYIAFVDFDTEAGTSRNPGRAVVDHDRRLQDFYLHDKGGGVEFRAKRNVRGRRHHVQAGGDGEPAFEHGSTVGSDAGRFRDRRNLARPHDPAGFHDLDAD